jgi:hypothetical protein
MIACQCTCGYSAASDGELGDHWGEAFIPPDDRDANGVRHAEAARDTAGRDQAARGMGARDQAADTEAAGAEAAGAARRGLSAAAGGAGVADASGVTSQDAGGARPRPGPFACLCGEVFDHLGKLDDHLLGAFIPADRRGLDGRGHAPAA